MLLLYNSFNVVLLTFFVLKNIFVFLMHYGTAIAMVLPEKRKKNVLKMMKLMNMMKMMKMIEMISA